MNFYYKRFDLKNFRYFVEFSDVNSQKECILEYIVIERKKNDGHGCSEKERWRKKNCVEINHSTRINNVILFT